MIRGGPWGWISGRKSSGSLAPFRKVMVCGSISFFGQSPDDGVTRMGIDLVREEGLQMDLTPSESHIDMVGGRVIRILFRLGNGCYGHGLKRFCLGTKSIQLLLALGGDHQR